MNLSTLLFTQNPELSPADNIDAFVDLCRYSDVLSARAQFDCDTWELGYFKGQNKINRVIFSSMEASQLSLPQPVIQSPFLEFAKAILIYLHDRRPVVSQSIRIAALRFLDAAFRQRGKESRPTQVSEEILDTAVELATSQLGAGASYRVAGQLELIADFMCSKEFIVLNQRWNHGLKKPNERNSRISKESIKAREEKLPSQAALRALGHIFDQSTRPMDVLVSSFTALMLCAPERINEVLRLTRNCIVFGEGRFNDKLGIRWPGSKGASDTTKWLPSDMVPVAKRAISKLLSVTDPAHRIALWYTNNPRSLFLDSDVEYLRDRSFLSLKEIGLILWGDESKESSVRTWLASNVTKSDFNHMDLSRGCSFNALQKAVLALLPATFPYVPGAPGLLCKDALGLMRLNESHSDKATFSCMFYCIDTAIITNAYGRSDRESIFERFDYTEDDGAPIRLKSHSLRHYLNMLAHAGGLTSAEIAIFSGRKETSQNRAYDHMTSNEVQAPVSKAIKEGFTANLVPASVRKLVTRSEFTSLGVAVAHTTDFGWCTHNFASDPCQMYRDCINCEEQVCVKGEGQKEANLRSLKVETEYLLNRAQLALSDQDYGADTWVKHQTKTLERVDSLLAIFDNQDVPDGAAIRLNVENAALITNADAKASSVAMKFERRDRLK